MGFGKNKPPLWGTVSDALARAARSMVLVWCCVALWPLEAGAAQNGGVAVKASRERDNIQLVRQDAGGAGLGGQPVESRVQAGAEAKEAVAVIYPELDEPYRSIFARIIEGIDDRLGSRARDYPIVSGADQADLNLRLRHAGIKTAIVLGRQGLQAASTLDKDVSVVAGGVLSAPESEGRFLTGVSLTPDPGLLFSRLKSLVPGVRRVTVIYDPQRNGWLIKLAREAARANGIELAAYEARDLASAARLYESAFASSDSRKDAIWLPQDATTVDEEIILPLVLKESWNRGIPVFSSSFLHVKKGALFALYPNNLRLGESLGNLALDVLNGDAGTQGMLPLRDVYIAVNLRTASHIGLNFGPQQRSFDSVFPEP